MAEIKISEIQNELLSPDSADRLEIADMDGNSGNPQTKYIKVENLQGDSIDFFDSGGTYNAGELVLRSANANDDGTYDNGVDDYRLYICQVDNTSGSWGGVSSDFQEVVFVTTDDSLTGDGFPGSALSVDVTGIDYSNNQDGLTIDTVVDALNFLMASNDFFIVADNNERSNLAQEEGRFVYNQGQSTFQKYEGGSWKDVTVFTDSELTTFLNSTSVTVLSDVSSAGSGSIITTSERNRLSPSTKEVTSLPTVTFDGTNYAEYTLDINNDYGKVIRFDGQSIGAPAGGILIKLPISDTLYPVGWHTFFIEYNSNTKIHLLPADSGDNTPQTNSSNPYLNPFVEVDFIAGYMGTVYNTRLSGSSDNRWSAIGNLVDGT